MATAVPLIHGRKLLADADWAAWQACIENTVLRTATCEGNQSNLCHGTGGNGYAFLKLYQRTGDSVWLHRAQAFAMHGIAQTKAEALQYGQMRHSLWTGDIGFAIYLWDCLRGRAEFPTLDVF